MDHLWNITETRITIPLSLTLLLNQAYKSAFKKKSPETTFIDCRGNVQATKEELQTIENVNNDIYCFISKYSNNRFGDNQHSFFERRAEQETFYKHIFISIVMYRREMLGVQANELNHLPPFSSQMLIGVTSLLEPQQRKFQLGAMALTGKQVFAFAFFYYFKFLFDAFIESDLERLTTLIAIWVHFKEDIDYSEGFGRIGGTKKSKKWDSRKRKAYKLFIENEVAGKFGPSKEAMASRLKELCAASKVPVSETTLRTRWIKEFIDKSKP